MLRYAQLLHHLLKKEIMSSVKLIRNVRGSATKR